jgi:hypothetical protein
VNGSAGLLAPRFFYGGGDMARRYHRQPYRRPRRRGRSRSSYDVPVQKINFWLVLAGIIYWLAQVFYGF